MDKLLWYLNEYDPYIQSDWTFTDNFWYYVYQWHSAVFSKDIWVNKIISRDYWFIIWLVEHYKIDMVVLCRNHTFNILSTSFNNYQSLLMTLAIHNTPLEFLASILK